MVKILANLPYEIIITYFDLKRGPKILINDLERQGNFEDKQRETEPEISERTITRLMDVYDDNDFHMHDDNGKFSFHFHFSINDPTIRGGRHKLMISAILPKPSYYTEQQYFVNVFKKKNEFKNWLKKISNIIHEDEFFNSLLRTQRTNIFNDPFMNSEIRHSLLKSMEKESSQTHFNRFIQSKGLKIEKF
ncbi:MAG: hypothetical protein ACTSWY_14980 [Promethearchaeota archaeon]